MQYFKPQSPDPFLLKDGDMALAKFGHLNAIVDELNQFHLNQTITAHAGGGQALAVKLITGINIVNTATNGDSVILPCIGTCTLSNCTCCTSTDVAAETTAPVIIKNNGPGTLTVYPCVGVAIDGQAVNAPIIVGVGSSISITRLDCSNWVTFGCCVVTDNDIISVTGCNVTEPTPGNIVIGDTVVDGVTITGTGCIGDPLVATLPCIVTPAPSYTPVLPEESVLTGTGAPLDCFDVCIDGVTITKNINGCLQAVPAPAGSIGYAEFVQHIAQAPVAPGTAIKYDTTPTGLDTIGIITTTGPGAIGTAFQLPIGVYMVDYENSADAAWSLAIYQGASNTVLAIDTNTISGASTATTWIHGRAIVVVTGVAVDDWIMISPVTGTQAIPTAGTAAGEFIARVTLLKIA